MSVYRTIGPLLFFFILFDIVDRQTIGQMDGKLQAGAIKKQSTESISSLK